MVGSEAEPTPRCIDHRADERPLSGERMAERMLEDRKGSTREQRRRSALVQQERAQQATPADSKTDSARGEWPRERLLAYGAECLTDAELVAVLLGTGARGSSAFRIARDLLEERAGLEGLLCSAPRQIRRHGVGAAKTASLLAALELGTRLARSELPERFALARPAAAARYLMLRYGRCDQEVMGAMYLDSRHRLIEDHEHYRGTLSRACVEPRVLLKTGLLCSAAAMVAFHTHPSGDPDPSVEDLTFTRRLAKAGEATGVQLLDHLVLGRGSFVSLRDRGGW